MGCLSLLLPSLSNLSLLRLLYVLNPREIKICAKEVEYCCSVTVNVCTFQIKQDINEAFAQERKPNDTSFASSQNGLSSYLKYQCAVCFIAISTNIEFFK